MLCSKKTSISLGIDLLCFLASASIRLCSFIGRLTVLNLYLFAIFSYPHIPNIIDKNRYKVISQKTDMYALRHIKQLYLENKQKEGPYPAGDIENKQKEAPGDIENIKPKLT